MNLDEIKTWAQCQTWAAKERLFFIAGKTPMPLEELRPHGYEWANDAAVKVREVEAGVRSEWIAERLADASQCVRFVRAPPVR